MLGPEESWIEHSTSLSDMLTCGGVSVKRQNAEDSATPIFIRGSAGDVGQWLSARPVRYCNSNVT